jgi:hypothetical protein
VGRRSPAGGDLTGRSPRPRNASSRSSPGANARSPGT